MPLTTRQIPINCIFKPVFGMKLHKKRINLPLFALIMHEKPMFLAPSSNKIKTVFKLYLSIIYGEIGENQLHYFPNDLDKS